MSPETDPLDQASRLARLDQRRPRQANLRRAVSSAYYALFHLLTGEAASLFVNDPAWLAPVCRTFNHTDLKRASAQIGAGKLPRAILQSGHAYTAPTDLKTVADAFVRLQSLRHEADYDRARAFTRTQTLAVVGEAQAAFEAWERVKKTDDARLYLACFLLWERWDKEPR